MLICRNSIACLAGYIGLLRAGAALLLVHHRLPSAALAELQRRFRPAFTYGPSEPVHGRSAEPAYELTAHDCGSALHSDLCLLLATSGTTGGRSFVRLSYRNVVHNAEAIAQCLGIVGGDRAVTTMPMSYSYGLSIINSHLIRGASLVVTEASLVDPLFWKAVREQRVTNFGGVPFLYEMLVKLRFSRMELPALRYITQAGGRLAAERTGQFVDICGEKGIRFITMYGQTEATARIAYVPWAQAAAKLGSIGVAIPGGGLSLIDENGAVVDEPGAVGELVYRGENVSLGYARDVGDLCRGDDNAGVLRTGDLAKRDVEGFYYLVGRKKRFLKIFGNRVNLDEVEQILGQAGFDCACGGEDDRMRVYLAGGAEPLAAAEALVKATSLSPHGFVVVPVAAIPRTEAGKVDYAALARHGEGGA